MENYAAQLLREFEGYRSSPYWDVNAYRAGYGSDTMTLADGRVVPITQGMTVSRADAERDLSRRLETEFMPRARSAVGAAWDGLQPTQQAALASITYNYGSLPSSVARAAQSGDASAVAAAIRALGSHNNGVNRDRRNREADIFGGAPMQNTPQGSGTPVQGGNYLAALAQPQTAPQMPVWQNSNAAPYATPRRQNALLDLSQFGVT